METLTNEEMMACFEEKEAIALRILAAIAITMFASLIISRLANTTLQGNAPTLDAINETIHFISIALTIAFVFASVMFFRARKAMRMLDILVNADWDENDFFDEI